MKSFTTLRRSAKTGLLLTMILTAGLLMLTPSCYVGADGRPGLAYIAFEWEVSKPDFIDCGTSSVPPNFYYGTYYRINPGRYTAYYDGKVWNGMAWGTYAWEMDYEIWVNPGQRGGYGYNGKDGMNTYLSFVCNPYGPKLFRHDAYLRKAPVEADIIDSEILPDGDQVVEYRVDDYSVRITYRKAEPGRRSSQGNFPLN
jgi:hypothetical protein